MMDLMHNLRREIGGLFEKSGFQKHPPFLRRAKSDDFLLCSDAPRRLLQPACTADLFREAGLPLTENDGLWFLDARDGDYKKLDSYLSADRPEKPQKEKYIDIWALCRMLNEHPGDIACQPLWAVRRSLKAIEAGEAQVLSLSESLPPHVAELLRKKEPLPYLAGKLLAQWLGEKMRRETV
jgi:hypothetical protein